MSRYRQTQPDGSSHGLAEHTVKGEISRVLFQSEENSYAVLRIRNGKDEITAVGNIAGAFEGQTIELSGTWENHREHGRQLRIREYKFTLPTTPRGIERYLASGIIPGIGPKYAKCIVEHFGTETLKIMDRFSERLREIPGFGRKRVDMIRKAWNENSERRETYIFLQGLGFSTAYCNRIYKTYGEESAASVRENPYRLADEVNGIGFKMADRAAESMGISKDDPKRLAAGILHALNQLSNAGHTCYPREKFLEYAAEILEVDQQGVLLGLQRSIESGKAVEDVSPDGNAMIYDSGYYRAENELGKLLTALMRAEKFKCRAMENARGNPEIPLGEEQIQAVEKACKYPLNIISGGPGVGKTTIVGEIVRRAQQSKLSVLLAAPTGRAAKRMSESSGLKAMTIHRMLKWDPVKKAFVHGKKYPLHCDLLIVDEVSMLDLPLAVHLLRALRPGTSLILVGDADQLPSVGAGTVLADFIQSGVFAVTRLSKIYRQGAGSSIIHNAHLVNSGRLPMPEKYKENEAGDFYWIEQDDPEQVLEIIRKTVCERIPRRFGFNPMNDIQVISPMNRGICGTVNLNGILQQELNPGNKPQFKLGERTFKSGDRVMQTVNDYDKKVFNGDMGRITNINGHDHTFSVNFDGYQVEYEFGEQDQITLSYAITVHKSQGSEFPAVVLPLLTQHYMMLQRNLLYTAMTRAGKLLVLIGSKKAVGMAVRNSRLEPRYSTLLEKIKNEKKSL